ncbi:GTPase activating protein [Gonapodya sp. JEL0774]|nr:GTPase activating protein [Gonapodya sp. JEL0774]
MERVSTWEQSPDDSDEEGDEPLFDIGFTLLQGFARVTRYAGHLKSLLPSPAELFASFDEPYNPADNDLPPRQRRAREHVPEISTHETENASGFYVENNVYLAKLAHKLQVEGERAHWNEMEGEKGRFAPDQEVAEGDTHAYDNEWKYFDDDPPRQLTTSTGTALFLDEVNDGCDLTGHSNLLAISAKDTTTLNPAFISARQSSIIDMQELSSELGFSDLESEAEDSFLGDSEGGDGVDVDLAGEIGLELQDMSLSESSLRAIQEPSTTNRAVYWSSTVEPSPLNFPHKLPSRTSSDSPSMAASGFEILQLDAATTPRDPLYATRPPSKKAPIGDGDLASLISGCKEEDIRAAAFHRGFEPTTRKFGWQWLLGVPGGDEERRKTEWEEVRKSWKYPLETSKPDDPAAPDSTAFHLIESDVLRSDRDLPIFKGKEARRTRTASSLVPPPDSKNGVQSQRWSRVDSEGSPHLSLLRDVLVTYTTCHLDGRELGYVQGMSDIASVCVVVFAGSGGGEGSLDEAGTYWGFVQMMARMGRNFTRDGGGVRQQLGTLASLLKAYFSIVGAEDLFFAYRWYIVLFKREFLDINDLVRLWDVILSNHLCVNFHHFIAVAILMEHKSGMMRHLKNVDEVLKYIGDLPGAISLSKTVKIATQKFVQFRDTSLGNRNNLTGPIPPLDGLSELRNLWMYNNNLTGRMPTLTNLPHLQTLFLSRNSLEGPIPALIGLNQITYIDFSFNKLSGIIPDLTGLTLLSTLRLRCNQLTGPIPDMSFMELLSLDLAQNSLYGNVDGLLPSEVMDMCMLMPQNGTGLYTCSNYFTADCRKGPPIPNGTSMFCPSFSIPARERVGASPLLLAVAVIGTFVVLVAVGYLVYRMRVGGKSAGSELLEFGRFKRIIRKRFSGKGQEQPDHTNRKSALTIPSLYPFGGAGVSARTIVEDAGLGSSPRQHPSSSVNLTSKIAPALVEQSYQSMENRRYGPSSETVVGSGQHIILTDEPPASAVADADMDTPQPSNEPAHWAYVWLVGALLANKPSVDLTLRRNPLTVQTEFEPRFPDELALAPIDRVKLRTVYRDGWGFGTNLRTRDSGVFPL